MILAPSCLLNTTSEDRRRATLMEEDPIFHTSFAGVTFSAPAGSTPGSAGGGSSNDSSAGRSGRIDGSARDIVREAAELAARLKWVIGSVDCSSSTAYFIGGGKQFSGFVAELGITVSPGAKTFFMEAVTASVGSGSDESQPLRTKALSDLSKSCRG